MKKIKRLLGVIICAALAAGAAFTAGPAKPVVVKAEPVFADISGHWAEEMIGRWAGYGVVSGFEGYFRPQDNITRAEFAAILDKAMNYSDIISYDSAVFTDLFTGDWYLEPILRLVDAGVINPDKNGLLRPTDNLTRAEEAVMLAKAFHLTPITGMVSFADNNSISLADKPYVKAMQENGYITGYAYMGGYEFRPGQTVTRAEAVAMLDAMVGAYVNEPVVFSENVAGNVLVAASGATLSGMSVAGNVYISKGVTGETMLDDVTVKKETVILGDGEVSINNSRINKLIVDGEGGTVIRTTGVTTVEAVEMRAGGDVYAGQSQYGYIRNVALPSDFPEYQNVTLSGNFMLLSNNADKSLVKTNSAVFNNIVPEMPTESSVKAGRPKNNQLSVTVESKSLGTLYMLILKGEADREPTNDEIMDSVNYHKISDIFDYGTYRVFPGSSDTYYFSGANQTLDIDKQGHVAYALIVDENGGITKLRSSPAYFKPAAEYAFAQSAAEIVVNFENHYDSSADVEQCFELSINSKGKVTTASFRAYSLLPDSDEGSRVYRLSLLYGVELNNNDIVTIKPINNTAGAVSCVFMDIGVRLVDVAASMTAAGYEVDVTGSVSVRSDVFCVVTDAYIPGYYSIAEAIARQDLDIPGGTSRYVSLTGVYGKFTMTVDGIGWQSDYYYVYMTARNKNNEYSEVTLLVIPKRR